MAAEVTEASLMKPNSSALRTSLCQEQPGSETKMKSGREKDKVQALLGRC